MNPFCLTISFITGELSIHRSCQNLISFPWPNIQLSRFWTKYLLSKISFHIFDEDLILVNCILSLFLLKYFSLTSCIDMLSGWVKIFKRLFTKKKHINIFDFSYSGAPFTFLSIYLPQGVVYVVFFLNNNLYYSSKENFYVLYQCLYKYIWEVSRQLIFFENQVRTINLRFLDSEVQVYYEEGPIKEHSVISVN